MKPVRALLTHTVLALDVGMFGVEAHVSLQLRAHAPARLARSPGSVSGTSLALAVFSLASGLSSTASAGDFAPLFGCFAGTTPLYDSPPPFMKDLPLIAFSFRPA
jgi:hypothetical protein